MGIDFLLDIAALNIRSHVRNERHIIMFMCSNKNLMMPQQKGDTNVICQRQAANQKSEPQHMQGLRNVQIGVQEEEGAAGWLLVLDERKVMGGGKGGMAWYYIHHVYLLSIHL